MTLYSSLISYWKQDETSGNRADSFGSQTLTDNNTVTSTTGLVYATAASFAAASSEFLSRASEAALQTGDIDFWAATWIYPTTIGTGGHALIGKWQLAGLEWFIQIYLLSGNNRVRFGVSSNGTGVTGDLDIVESGMTVNNWHLIVAWHNSVANTINFQLDNGTVRSLSYSGGVLAGSSRFAIGTLGAGSYYAGRQGPSMFGKSLIPSAGKRTWLYNSGAGRTLATMSVADVLAGLAAGSSTTSAILRGKSGLEGVISGEASSLATLFAVGYLNGSALGSVSVVATSSAIGYLRATEVGSAVETALLKAKGYLNGLALGSSIALATATSDFALSGLTAGQATVTGILFAAGYLIGQSSGLTTVSGTLFSATFISGQSSGISTIIGVIIARGYLSGSAVGSSTASLDSGLGYTERVMTKGMYRGMFKSFA